MASYMIHTSANGDKPEQWGVLNAKSVTDAVAQLDLDDGDEVEVFTLRSSAPKKYRLRTETVTRLEAL